MVEFTLPANSKIDKSAGITHKAPAGAKDDIVLEVDLDEVRMGGLEAGQTFRDEVLHLVDELLHLGRCVRGHAGLPSVTGW